MSVSTTTAVLDENYFKDGCTCLKTLSKADQRLEVDETPNSSVKVDSGMNESLSQNAAVVDDEKRKVLDSLPRYIQILLEFIGIHDDEIMGSCKIDVEFFSQLNGAAERLHR
jgi:hypothetical protein